MPPCRHPCSTTPDIQTSIPPYRYACSSLLDPHTTMSPRPYAITHLQRFRPPCLHVSTPAVHLQASMHLCRPRPYLQHTSIPPRRCTYNTSPELMLLCL